MAGEALPPVGARPMSAALADLPIWRLSNNSDLVLASAAHRTWPSAPSRLIACIRRPARPG
jgi:hypothetical protein